MPNSAQSEFQLPGSNTYPRISRGDLGIAFQSTPLEPHPHSDLPNTLSPFHNHPQPTMTLEPREHHTSIATLVVASTQLIEIHYHEHIVFNVKAVGEVQAKRREVMGNRTYATLTLIPENVDFHLDAMSTDQSAPDRMESQLLATAIVAKADAIQKLTDLYLSYFPQLQRILVTNDEQEARTWLDGQLEAIARTGS